MQKLTCTRRNVSSGRDSLFADIYERRSVCQKHLMVRDTTGDVGVGGLKTQMQSRLGK